MVKVIFYNLLRSKYGINEILVKDGSISQIIDEIVSRHSNIIRNDFETSIVFYHGKPIHYHNFSTVIDDNEEIIITHFVGGG